VIATPTRYTVEEPERYQFTGVSMDYDAQYPYWPNLSKDNEPGFDNAWIVDNGPGLTVRTYENSPQRPHRHWLKNDYSLYNVATFTYGNIPSYMSSLGEQDLLLAEVAAKGLASTGKSAADHIRDAVVHSTDMWYYVNSLTNIWNTEGMPARNDFLTKAYQPEKPAAASIEKFADKIKTYFAAASGVEDQMEIIMQQKYIHLNILCVYELWAELRRTRHPKLEKLKAQENVHAPLPERVTYPTRELQTNTDNYNAKSEQNNFVTPIFWVPADKKGQSYYMDGWLPLKGFLPLPTPNPNRPTPKDYQGEQIWSRWIP
jgi:hypothetical protein